MSPPVPGTVHEQNHPLIVRITHWLTALAVLIMIGSGWRIYDNAPILPFQFPFGVTLGGSKFVDTTVNNEWGTANAIAWHFAGMWLLATSFLIYLANGVISGHFRRDFLPLGPRQFLRDFIAAARFKLAHSLGEYNAVQKLFYWGVIFSICMMILSGLAIWKPVQLPWLSWLFGEFVFARIVHFGFMTIIAGFIVIHVTLVILVPKTFVAMTLGHASETPHAPAHAAPKHGAAE